MKLQSIDCGFVTIVSRNATVGHSFGGTVIAKVAEDVADRIKRLVFFDAFIPRDGQSLVDQMSEPDLHAPAGSLFQRLDLKKFYSLDRKRLRCNFLISRQ